MVLSKSEIMHRCEDENEKLITPFCHDNIQACSYDLTMGSQYYFHKKAYGDAVYVSTLQKDEILRIPPHAICYVITEESVNMPLDLTASISLSFGLISSGVMLAAQPPYDPGYSGKTVALLHNLSDQYIKIKRGQHILNMVFTRLDEPISEADKYHGKYQDLKDLKKYCTEKRVGAVFELNQKFQSASSRINRSLPTLLTIITVIIGLLTFLLTIQTSRNAGQASPSNDAIVQDSSTPSFSVDKERNIIVVEIDGQTYDLNLNTNTLSSDEYCTD